jgi:ribosome biogenesis protein BMS1
MVQKQRTVTRVLCTVTRQSHVLRQNFAMNMPIDRIPKAHRAQSRNTANKAFAPRSGRRAERQGRRNVELEQNRLHVPLVNKTPDDNPPPVIVAIVGPPSVGKTTLLKSLVRRYTKQTLREVKGAVTVVSGKNRRLTFIECNNDLSSMIDIGKVADLVLLMIDGSFGFEMVCSCYHQDFRC